MSCYRLAAGPGAGPVIGCFGIVGSRMPAAPHGWPVIALFVQIKTTAPPTLGFYSPKQFLTTSSIKTTMAYFFSVRFLLRISPPK